MSVLTINGTTNTDGTSGDENSEQRRSWALDCTDVFGRPYSLTITAYRSPKPCIDIKAPSGEYAFVEVNRAGDLAFVLTEARRFVHGGQGGERVRSAPAMRPEREVVAWR